MPRMEAIIRPFVSVDVRPVRSLAQLPVPEAETLLVEIGKEGASKSLNGSASYSRSRYMDSKQTEISREVSVKRVENPDDSSQFVDVEVIDKLVTEQGGQADYKHIELELNNETEE